MKRNGFTLIELVMVIVLISIVAAIAVPRLRDTTSTKAGAFVNKLRADIRYAQDLAMTRGRRTRVSLTPASYTVAQDDSALITCGSFTAVSDPAGSGSLSVSLNTGTYAGIFIWYTMACLEYDSLGRPYACGGGACSTNPSGVTILVYANAVLVGTVTVSAQTGAVN